MAKIPFVLDRYRPTTTDVWCYGPENLRFRFQLEDPTFDVRREATEPMMLSIVEALNEWWGQKNSPSPHIRVSKNETGLWKAWVETRPHISAEAITPNEAVDEVLALLV